MDALYLIFFFVLGTLISSFLCVVGLRLPQGITFVKGKSRCDSCHHELHFFEMIPIISYLVQKGKCRYCQNQISSIIPICEIIGGLLFAISYYIFGLSYNLLLSLGISALFIIVMVTDVTYYIIPDSIIIFFGLYFSVIQFLIGGLKGVYNHLISAVILFLIMYLLMILGEKLFKKESLGGGDVKLLFVFGLVLDPLLGVLAIFFGSLIALPCSLFIIFKEKTNMIPFGPFLLLAFALIFYSQVTSSQIIRLFT